MRGLLVCALLLCSSASAQDDVDDVSTVGEIQDQWREGSADSNRMVQIIFMSLLRGYTIGLAHGLAGGALAFGSTDEDWTAELVSCMPEPDRLFYMLLAAPASDENLTVPDFIGKVIVDECDDTMERLVKAEQ
jgi:hypothetical protein